MSEARLELTRARLRELAAASLPRLTPEVEATLASARVLGTGSWSSGPPYCLLNETYGDARGYFRAGYDASDGVALDEAIRREAGLGRDSFARVVVEVTDP